MRLDISQDMQMDQRMVLAPRMIQSMEILQLPMLALQERIEQEMLSNPVLEQDESYESADRQPGDQVASRAEQVPDGEKPLRVADDNSKTQDFERLDSMGADYGDDYFDRSSYVRSRRTRDDRPDRKFEAMQNTAAPGQSLAEHLLEQWAFVECEPVIKEAGLAIIELIAETGYLSVPLESLTDHIRTSVNAEQLQQALQLVQTLDPPGVGARDLVECLLTQLKSGGQDRSLEIELVSKHLHDIQMNRFPAVARKTGRSIADINKALEVISRLDPRPGLQIGSHNAPHIVPEIIVEYDEQNDTYTARLSDSHLPSLRINTIYTNMIKKGNVSSDTKEFVQNNIRSARWLIESIAQRKTTLLRVVNHVLQSQRAFFDHGPLHLKPLPMLEVAATLGIHVGTVSRAVSGKYMQTPSGIFPLRSFFSGGTETAGGQSLSWEAVKAKMQVIVNDEDKANPFSDDQLVKELERHGLKLARRTVAKYRNILNIPPARRRKQYK